MWVYLELLSHFLPFKIHLTNILPILIKMVDFKNLAWATSFATRAGRKFIYLPYRASGKKSYCHPLLWHGSIGGGREGNQAREKLVFKSKSSVGGGGGGGGGERERERERTRRREDFFILF